MRIFREGIQTALHAHECTSQLMLALGLTMDQEHYVSSKPTQPAFDDEK